MIDILMTTYNAENYLEEQLESIVNQTASNWKLTILDDNSTDSTIEILKNYRLKYPDRITAYCNKNHSGCAKKNFFRLLPFAKHNYIMFCDHDDVWNSDKIEKTYRRMLELEEHVANPHAPLLVHTDLTVVDENLNILQDSFSKSQNLEVKDSKLSRVLSQGLVTGCTMMINANLLNMLGNFSENIIMHDWWACLVATCFGRTSFFDESTIKYRQHTDNQIGTKKINNIFYNLKRLFKFAESKEAINQTYQQASEFLHRFSSELNSRQVSLISIYANMPKYNKAKRIYFLHKYNFFKNGFFRKLGQILYC